MHFVFTKFFYFLAALGFIPLALSWQRPWLAWVALGYDLLLLIAAVVDAHTSKLPRGFRVSRQFGGRFAMGAETEVKIQIENASNRAVSLIIKDEFPPQMIMTGEREGAVRVPAHGTAALIYGLTPPRRGRFEFGHTALRFRSRLNLVWRDARGAEPVAVKVYPNMRRAREAELKALRAQIDPHFLFNSLNSISALSVSDPPGARRMCLLLADFLRTSLLLGTKSQISVVEELKLVDHFLDIEKSVTDHACR